MTRPAILVMGLFLNNSQREDEIDNEPCPGPNSNPPQLDRNSSGSGLDQQTVSSDSPCATLDANSSVSPSISKGTAKTATTISGISHPYMMENSPAIGSTMCVPPSMTFAPTPHAALAFPPPPSFVPPAIPPPEAVIRIAHAIASRATDYLKKPNVFRLKTREGAEYLFEVADAKELDMWVERINFVAALLSAPSIPGPIGSERGFYRPHLPVTCTKLSMREQLEEHQRRLIELGRELSDLHKRLPITSGSKTLRPTRASSISGRTSDVARAAAAAVLARNANRESKSAKKDENSVASDITTGTMEVDLISSTEQQRVDENNTEPVTTSNTNSTSAVTNATNTSSSSTVSLISVFSTSSLGRRRKTSSGSLCGTADTTLGPVLTAKQRAEHEERVQFTEAEIHRYKTYARLLEAELFRIQQSSAAVAHAAALAAANNFSPYINPYNLPGNYHGFQQYSPIGFGSGLGMPFSTPVPTQPPRHFLPRDHPAPAYTAAPNMLPLAVLGPTDPLEEESTSAEHTLDPVSSTSHANTSGCMNTAPLPSLYPVPATVPVATRPRSLSYSYYGHQLIPPSPYSPSVSGRFYSHPRQLRNPHFRQQPQQLGFGAPGSGSFGRTNGMMMLMNGHRLAEEDSTTESPSSDPVTVPTEGEPSSNSICSTSGNADKFKVPLQSSQPLCSTEGMFYEIV
ncbi:PH and SEC7 domain-containing protein 3 [Fasciola hepatica]|uniref:PH and SEC7 domain-containing protein 3 n=1 Tax=Fasciola hepatica TaxID=6192 RepID=A0A4E0RCN9_FASHE|nr:PH and SEC7 domain-containing protein 3 [Fasciola hepatica]